MNICMYFSLQFFFFSVTNMESLSVPNLFLLTRHDISLVQSLSTYKRIWNRLFHVKVMAFNKYLGYNKYTKLQIYLIKILNVYYPSELPLPIVSTSYHLYFLSSLFLFHSRCPPPYRLYFVSLSYLVSILFNIILLLLFQCSPSLSSLDGSSAPEYEEKHVGFSRIILSLFYHL